MLVVFVVVALAFGGTARQNWQLPEKESFCGTNRLALFLHPAETAIALKGKSQDHPYMATSKSGCFGAPKSGEVPLRNGQKCANLGWGRINVTYL